MQQPEQKDSTAGCTPDQPLRGREVTKYELTQEFRDAEARSKVRAKKRRKCWRTRPFGHFYKRELLDSIFTPPKCVWCGKVNKWIY